MGGRCNSIIFSEERWEVKKLAFIVVFHILSVLANWAALAYIHDISGREPLPDIIFSIVPEVPMAAKIGDIMLVSCIACLLLLVIFHQIRYTIFRRVVFILAMMNTMRSMTLMATQLPPGFSNNTLHCRERLINRSLKIFMSRVGEQASLVGMQGGSGMLCGDLIFSGHTLMMMVCQLTVAHYLPTKWKFLRFLPRCLAYVGMTCMIVSRSHYTIDVVIAHWLTTFTFASYHAYAESDIVWRRQSVLHKYAFFRLIAWLEENSVIGRMENVNPIKILRHRQCSNPAVLRDVKEM